MIPHDQIPWVRLRGSGAPVDHAVARTGSWVHTACDLFTPSYEETAVPKRKCRKCVAVLKTVFLNDGELECDCRVRFPAPLEVHAGVVVTCPECRRSYVGVADDAHGHWVPKEKS